MYAHCCFKNESVSLVIKFLTNYNNRDLARAETREAEVTLTASILYKLIIILLNL